ncbi:MAG: hypothetical protein U0800_08495 [Isosphaeraceae bacterium]
MAATIPIKPGRNGAIPRPHESAEVLELQARIKQLQARLEKAEAELAERRRSYSPPSFEAVAAAMAEGKPTPIAHPVNDANEVEQVRTLFLALGKARAAARKLIEEQSAEALGKLLPVRAANFARQRAALAELLAAVQEHNQLRQAVAEAGIVSTSDDWYVVMGAEHIEDGLARFDDVVRRITRKEGGR